MHRVRIAALVACHATPHPFVSGLLSAIVLLMRVASSSLKSASSKMDSLMVDRSLPRSRWSTMRASIWIMSWPKVRWNVRKSGAAGMYFQMMASI